MELAKWVDSFEHIIQNIYKNDKAQQESLIDAMMSPDIKLEQFAFSVQGRSSVKHIFNLRRIFNKGQSFIENISFNNLTKTATASFCHEVKFQFLPVSTMEYTSFTVFQLKEIEEDKWMIYYIQDTVNTQSIVRSIPFIGSFYESFARPLAGAALVALGKVSESNFLKLCYEQDDSTSSDEKDVSKEEYNRLFTCTEQYRISIDKAYRQASER